MPVLLRVARIEELPEGTSRAVKVRGVRLRVAHVDDRYVAFERACDLPAKGVTAEMISAAPASSIAYRTEVRPPYVYVAIDADREHAPSDVHEISLHAMKAPPPNAVVGVG